MGWLEEAVETIHGYCEDEGLVDILEQYAEVWEQARGRMTLSEANELCKGVYASMETIQTHGIERLLRKVFHRPKVVFTSFVAKALEEDANLIRDLPLKGYISSVTHL